MVVRQRLGRLEVCYAKSRMYVNFFETHIIWYPTTSNNVFGSLSSSRRATKLQEFSFNFLYLYQHWTTPTLDFTCRIDGRTEDRMEFYEREFKWARDTIAEGIYDYFHFPSICHSRVSSRMILEQSKPRESNL